jgi:hypothetical protein
VEALPAGSEHRSVGFVDQPAGDVHGVVGIDPEQVAVEGEAVDHAEREAVDNSRDALGLDVRDDVGRLDERAFAQRADGAVASIGPHDVDLEALLVDPDASLARGLRVVPEEVVHPGLCGGWELPGTAVLHRRAPDEVAR